MRIAVVGGGLLACSTVANLSLVQEIDSARSADQDKKKVAEKHTVTLFCREDHPGGHDFRSVSVHDDDNILSSTSVEVGLYRTLPHVQGSYLADLLELANGEAGTISVFGRRLRIPGFSRVMRGRRGAAPSLTPWASGSYGRLIRSSAVWDFAKDDYSPIHKGWPLLDLMRKLLSNELWRAACVAAFCWAVRRVLKLEGHLARGQGLVLCVVLLAPVILSPAGIVELWQRTYSFWGSTFPALITHGLTAGIARGSTEGFFKAMADNNLKNRATCARSIGELVRRTGLEPYVRGSGNDYTNKFKYDAEFVKRYIAPFVDTGYPTSTAGFEGINSLACHFSLYDADYSNSDAHKRITRITPGNVALCQGLIDAAKATTPVDVKYNCAVEQIEYDETKDVYTITTNNNRKFLVDAVILAECPEDKHALSLGSDSEDLEHLLGYGEDGDAQNKSTSESTASSHIAVVQGVASASFFRFSSEKHIPDVISVTDCAEFSRFERVREVTKESGTGVYVVYCSAEFPDSDVLKNMFEQSPAAKMAHFGTRDSKNSGNLYAAQMVEKKHALDDAMPQLVWGKRFIYAAASKAVARHPEMDAMAALNAASLLSKAVKWQVAKDDDEDDEIEDGIEVEEDEENQGDEICIDDEEKEALHC